MFRGFVRDESGMALGLAIVMIVLVGVMGSGLLIFVRNDLEAVIEVNQGRKALEAADAGAQAAKEHLRLNANPKSYDNEAEVEDSVWSHPEADEGGKDMTFDDGSANIKVRYLQPAKDEEEAGEAEHAPEVLPDGQDEYPNESDYFRIISKGTVGNANRIVESIYQARPGEQPGPYILERWSWRECYSKDCG